jgi:signal transduction histidine kinase
MTSLLTTFAYWASRYFFPAFPTEHEGEFRDQYNENNARVAWMGMVIGECIYLIFYFWDRTVDYEQSFNTLFIRLGVGFWFLMFILLPRRIFSDYLQTIMATNIAIAGIAVVAIIWLIEDGLNIGLSGVVLVLMFNFGFFRLLFLPSVIAGVIICVAYNAASIIDDLKIERIIANNFFLISALASGASITFLLERLFRAKFISDKELSQERDALARQTQTDSRHLEWLRRLARFLRHEVRQPVAQISSSIELINMIYPNDERVKPHVAGASLGVQDVWNLIERASQATDAEAFVRQSKTQQVDLRNALAEIIHGYSQTHSGITFALESAEAVRVNADPTLVKEAIGNVLANAASFADEDSVIQVVLEARDARAMVRVRNRGPLIAGDPEVLFGSFTSTRSGPSSEHQGLGLYLVRLIAEHYGGTATIGNLEDRSGVETSIVLPLRV